MEVRNNSLEGRIIMSKESWIAEEQLILDSRICIYCEQYENPNHNKSKSDDYGADIFDENFIVLNNSNTGESSSAHSECYFFKMNDTPY